MEEEEDYIGQVTSIAPYLAALSVVVSLQHAADVRRLAANSFVARYTIAIGEGVLIRTADRFWPYMVAIGIVVTVAVGFVRGRAALAMMVFAAITGAAFGSFFGGYAELLYGLEVGFRIQALWWGIAAVPSAALIAFGIYKEPEGLIEALADDGGRLLLKLGKWVVVLVVAAVGAITSLIGGHDQQTEARSSPAVTAAATTVDDTTVVAALAPTPTASFDPAASVWGDWPTATKPDISAFATGDAVSYLQGVLILRASQTGLTVTGTFDGATAQAVMALQAISGLQPTGIVDAATWAVVDGLSS